MKFALPVLLSLAGGLITAESPEWSEVLVFQSYLTFCTPKQDDGVEGYAPIFSCEKYKITTHYRTNIDRRMLDPTKKIPKYNDKGEDTARWFSLVQFSRSVVFDSLQPHESQNARPPCPSPSPGVHTNARPSSWWCHTAISSSVVPFSSCPQSFPAPESFPMSQLFTWAGHSTGVSALASFLPKNTQGWSPSEWTGWISLQSKGLSRVFSNPTVQKHHFFCAQPSSQSNSHIHTWPLEKL